MLRLPFIVPMLVVTSLVAWASAPAQVSVATGNTLDVGTTITDIAGKRYPLADKNQTATVLVFIAHDCPICNFYAPEINRLTLDYGQRKVRFFVVYAERLSVQEARDHARAFGFRVPLVRDSNFRLSHVLGAQVTPEAAVLSPEGRRLYLGRIDNRFADFGKKRARATQRDLREALDAVLKGEPVPHPKTTAVGCFIPEQVK